MSRCIEVAKKGIGKTYPNPSVGCLIVNEGTVISEAFSSEYGENHAEVNAINKVKNKNLLKTSTLYVTLEPCSHYGKTPPCCNTISKNKIPNVVIGTADNSNKVNGKGIEFLRKNNINVTYGVLEKKCKELHKNFLYFNKNKRPYIILKWAQSNDKLFSPLKKIKKKPFWISSKKSRQLSHKWRSEEHAILVGYNTVINDNPNLNVRSWKGKNPIRIIIDYDNKLSNKFNVFNDQAKTIKITRKNIDPSLHVASEISSFLFRENIQSVIVEGGKKTLEEFIKTNLWDEARIFTNKKNLSKGIEAPKLKGQIILEKKIDDDELKIIKPF
tara:strand:- start:13497 stop:14480 length:984 start_codon:yes stop_codon:yes gene_type:complete